MSIKLAELLHGFIERASGLAKLDHAWLKVAQRPFDEAVTLFEVRKKEVPEWMLPRGKKKLRGHRHSEQVESTSVLV